MMEAYVPYSERVRVLVPSPTLNNSEQAWVANSNCKQTKVDLAKPGDHPGNPSLILLYAIALHLEKYQSCKIHTGDPPITFVRISAAELIMDFLSILRQ